MNETSNDESITCSRKCGRTDFISLFIVCGCGWWYYRWVEYFVLTSSKTSSKLEIGNGRWRGGEPRKDCILCRFQWKGMQSGEAMNRSIIAKKTYWICELIVVRTAFILILSFKTYLEFHYSAGVFDFFTALLGKHEPSCTQSSMQYLCRAIVQYCGCKASLFSSTRHYPCDWWWQLTCPLK